MSGRFSALKSALCLFLALVELVVSAQIAYAGGTMKVPLTPERIQACKRLLTRKGIDLPPDANITNIEITAEDWVCTSCGSEVHGLPASFPKTAAKCDNCGSPMEPNDGELYKRNPEGKLVLRDDQIDAVLDMGANWTCEYCHSGGNRDKINGKINKTCENCGAERADFTDYVGKNGEAHIKRTDFSKPAPAPAQASVDARAAAREESDALKARHEELKNVSVGDVRQILIRNKKGAIIGGGIVAALGLALFTYVTLKDTKKKGRVNGARWIQTVRVEQYQPVIERGKRSEIKEEQPVMPVNGEGGKPGARIIECTGDTCLYETYKWIEVDSKVKRGNYDDAIPGSSGWAQLEVPANGRLSMNTRYSVDFDFNVNGEKYSTQWRPQSYDEFRQFKPGAEITVQVDPLKNVESIRGDR